MLADELQGRIAALPAIASIKIPACPRHRRANV
ncbi:dihydrodipicolinate synthase [Klebsiella pneumoniae]|uniref:Dihydrodipicolinate synthase n=1 Tax=Klebsiella pneumoniae TaxID=573 RepID=A0A378AAC9_KLEPN|nr:dihydrodipicolinate synthase [Klebsiella pneumoniae]